MSGPIYQPQREDDPYDLRGGPDRWRWYEPTGYVFYEGWLTVARLEGLTGTDNRVLHGLLAHCDWSNRCLCTYAELGRAIGLTRSQVSRAMPRLVRLRLVWCERQAGSKSYAVTLSPELCWKGRPWHLARARESFRAQWRLQHGSCLAPPACGEEPSPTPDGTQRGGTAPSLLQQALAILSSV